MVSFLLIDKPWFLTEGKRATVLITPSSWGSQQAGHSPRIRVIVLVNHPGTPKPWAIAHENGPKTQKNDVFLVMPLKHVISVMGLVNHPGTPNLWAIAHENGHKRKNDEFLVMSLKHVLSVMGLVNHPRTPKLWAIAHENGTKMQKR
jgi:hypothetical protein